MSHLVGSLIMLTWDGKCVPALGNTLNHLHFQQLFAYPANGLEQVLATHFFLNNAALVITTVAVMKLC